MKFDINNLPDGFPPDGMIQSHGKPYITHVGLVWLANHRGKPWSGAIVDHEIRLDSNANPVFCKVIYKVWDDEQEHTDIGDATVKNTGRMIAPHLIRMASTRAQNRALRAFVGYAGCTADELGQYDLESGSRQVTNRNGNSAAAFDDSTPRPAAVVGQNRGSQSKGHRGPSCPCCGSRVYDNREYATGKQPLFVCSAKEQCAGAKKRGDNVYGWSSWDANWWDKELAKAKADAEELAAYGGNPHVDGGDVGYGEKYPDINPEDLSELADSLAMEANDGPF